MNTAAIMMTMIAEHGTSTTVPTKSPATLHISDTATDNSITPILSATEITAMRSITPGLRPGAGCAMRRAMNNGRFTIQRLYYLILIGFSTIFPSVSVETSRPLAAFIILTPPQTPPSGGASGATRKVPGGKNTEKVKRYLIARYLLSCKIYAK